MAVNKRKLNLKLPHTHCRTYLHSTKTTSFIYVSACWDVRWICWNSNYSYCKITVVYFNFVKFTM